MIDKQKGRDRKKHRRDKERDESEKENERDRDSRERETDRQTGKKKNRKGRKSTYILKFKPMLHTAKHCTHALQPTRTQHIDHHNQSKTIVSSSVVSIFRYIQKLQLPC